ncbi:MAG: MCP four helix bundle domain-containing protein, partial [Dehalococcoidia bacterium]|nr:MCP four helix bundle domain-containing protein [Dehalococcoidia bacterium]
MSWINNLRLQPKLLGGFSLVLALMVTIAVIAAREFNSSSSDVQHMYEHEVDGIQNVLLTNWAYTASARDLRGAALTNDAPTRSATLKRATDELKQGQDAFTKYEATLDTEEERQQVAELKQLVTQTTATRQKALDAMLAGDIDGGLKLEMDQTDTVVRQNTLLDEAGARAEAAARTRAGDLTSATSSAQRMVIVVSVVAVLLGLGIAFYLARRIKSDVALVSSRMKSIEENCLVSLEQGIKAVEEGNLLVAAHPVTPKIDHCAKDELGEMATTINGMIDK